MSIIKTTRLAFVITSVPLCQLSLPAAAQNSRGAEIEEVIVTVARREQSLQDYAGTAVAFSQSDLQRRGVGFDFQSIQAVVPGLHISFNEGFQEIYIRGIGTQSNGASADQPTAVHYNGAYVPKMRGLGPVMFDLQRIEVNQGPQGTLRGRNATAGSINILPRLPELEEVNGKLAVGTGEFDLRETELALNLPVSETLALRAAYFSREHDDYYSNAGRGASAQDVRGSGSEDEEAVRLSARWEPDARFSATLVYDYMTMGGSGFPGQYGGQLFSQGGTIDDLDDPWEQFFQTRGRVDNEIDSLVLTLIYEFDAFGVELIASQRQFEGLTVNSRRPFQYGFVSDEVRSVEDIIEAGRWSADNFNTNYISDDNETTTAELRFFARGDSDLFWTGGLFYADETADEFRWDTSDAPALSQTNLGGPDLTNAGSESLSAYFDATYSLSDSLRIKGGWRYTREEKDFSWWEAQISLGTFADTTDLDNDGDTTELVGAGDAGLDNLVRLSTPGFAVVPAGAQRLANPLTDFADAEAFLRSFIKRFGGRDTLDDVLAANPGIGTITTTFPAGVFSQDYDDNYIDWRLGVEYDLSGASLVYGSVTTGTRAGGVNTPVFDAGGNALAQTFDPEELTAYEIGLKSQFDWRDMPVTFNVSAFYYQYEDQVFQVGVAGAGGFDPDATNVAANLQQVSVNAGESSVLGLTLDGNLRFGPGFTFGWNILLADSEVDEGFTLDGRQTTQMVDVDGDPNTPAVAVGAPNIDISGNPLINQSDLTAVFDLGQVLDVAWGTLDWTLTASYRSEFHATPFNNQGYDNLGNPIPLAEMVTCCGSAGAAAFGDGRFYNDEVDATLLWNIAAGTNFGDNDQYRLEAYGLNITEEAYAQKQIINHFVNIAFINTPRTFGLRFKADF